MSETELSLSPAQMEGLIFTLRGQRVLLSPHLAELYGVETKVMIQAVQRNIERFPSDFMFQLTDEEFAGLRSQIVTSKTRGGTQYLPYAFTEQGVAMLSGVLRSPRAIAVNIEIMRTFVRLRYLMTNNAELARKLENLEQKTDARFSLVFDAIRQLMTPPVEQQRKIGIRCEPGEMDSK